MSSIEDIDALAQEIRRVDGNHMFGAGALAELLMPFVEEMVKRKAVALEPAPNGWRIVPLQPTPQMSKAAADAWLDCGSRLILNKAGAAVQAAIGKAPNYKEHQ